MNAIQQLTEDLMGPPKGHLSRMDVKEVERRIWFLLSEEKKDKEMGEMLDDAIRDIMGISEV